MYIADSSVASIASAFASLKPAQGEGVVLLLAEQSAPDLSQLAACLREQRAWFGGALFPGLIHGGKKVDTGAILTSRPLLAEPFVAEDLSRSALHMPAAAARVSEALDSPITALIFADANASNISGFLAEVFGLFGNTANYVGAGAGFMDLRKAPCVFCRQGAFRDAGLVIPLSRRSALGVRHGWQRLTGPVVATRTTGNVIHELNWKNAFEVYSETVSKDEGTRLTREGFPSMSQCYPFGILKEHAEDVVRDPIAVTPAGALACLGEIPENAVLNILRGTRRALISAAGDAADACLRAVAGRPRNALVVDCISRTLFLGDSFGDEMALVQKKLAQAGIPAPDGVLSLGEISSTGEGLVDFLNKTIVVGVLYDA